MRKALTRPHRPHTQALESRVLFATTALGAAADTYVRDGSFAGQNFGTGTEMHVKLSGTDFNREGLIRFNIGTVGSTVTSAKLQLYAALQDNRSTSVLTDVYGAGTTWSETTVNWNNRPAATTGKLATFTILDTAQRLYEVDVTSAVQAAKTAGATSVAFILRNPATA